MHPPIRRRTLNGSATAKLTGDEEKRVRERAEDCGLTTSEWCRQVILKALDAPPETRIVVAEFMALRALLLTLHTDVLQGRDVTKERIAAALEQGDAKKYAMADSRLQQYRSEAAKPRAEEAKA
ncbi:MAG: plasmid mobilization protein [Bryobacteraceae bacterium]